MWDTAHARQNGARIGEGQAGVQALRCRRRAASADDLAATIIGDQNKRFRLRRLPGETFGGQPWQTQRQYAAA